MPTIDVLHNDAPCCGHRTVENPQKVIGLKVPVSGDRVGPGVPWWLSQVQSSDFNTGSDFRSTIAVGVKF